MVSDTIVDVSLVIVLWILLVGYGMVFIIPLSQSTIGLYLSVSSVLGLLGLSHLLVNSLTLLELEFETIRKQRNF